MSRVPKFASAVLFALTLLVYISAQSRASDVPAPAKQAGAELDARVARLIVQLGDSQYHAREKAQEELRRLGPVAFDALLAAQDHEDIEIAMRARYLVRSLPIVWTKDGDPAQIKQLFTKYSEADRTERQTRIKHFATLESFAGMTALCRIMRYESDRILSKQAAVFVLQGPWPESEEQRQQLAGRIQDEVALCQRPGAQWLLTYARSLESPSMTISDWERMTQAEADVLAKNPQVTSRDIVRDLLRWQAELLLRINRESDALATIRREFDLIMDNRQDLYELLDWSIERKLHRIADELAERFAPQFHDDPLLLYRLAESQLKRGQTETADATASQARQLMPNHAYQHYAVAETLQRRLLTEWAEREFRQAIELMKPDDPLGGKIRWQFAEMLFDWGREREAAEIAETIIEAGKKSPQIFEAILLDPSQVQAYTYYYHGMHFARVGDREKQIEFFRKAIDAYPTNSDFMIAMHRVPNPDEAWTKEVKQRIDAWSGQLRSEIRSHEEFLQRPLDEEDRTEYGEKLAQICNELAWLLSNTERDLQEALQASQRSLELSPDYPPYLDTLGRCYYALGDYKTAVKHQTRAVEKMATHPRLPPYLYVMQRQLQLFEKALADSEGKQDKPAAEPKAN